MHLSVRLICVHSLQVCSFMQLILESEEGAGGTAAAQGGVARAMMHPAVLDAVSFIIWKRNEWSFFYHLHSSG